MKCARTVRVIKLGGSLFDLPQLPRVLAEWLARQSPATQLLLAGGGPMADFIRSADRQFQLDPAAAHWACVCILSASARLVAGLLPKAKLGSRVTDLCVELERGEPATLVVDPQEFLCVAEPAVPGPVLPHDWRVTSDSIAARLAAWSRADELVLLKSRDLPRGISRASAATAGLVDDYFAIAAASLATVRWVNLRVPAASEQLLT